MKKEHDSILNCIYREKLIAILRGVPMERLDGVVSSLIRGGVRFWSLPSTTTVQTVCGRIRKKSGGRWKSTAIR